MENNKTQDIFLAHLRELHERLSLYIIEGGDHSMKYHLRQKADINTSNFTSENQTPQE